MHKQRICHCHSARLTAGGSELPCHSGSAPSPSKNCKLETLENQAYELAPAPGMLGSLHSMYSTFTRTAFTPEWSPKTSLHLTTHDRSNFEATTTQYSSSQAIGARQPEAA